MTNEQERDKNLGTPLTREELEQTLDILNRVGLRATIAASLANDSKKIAPSERVEQAEKIKNEIQKLIRKYTYADMAPALVGWVYNLIESGIVALDQQRSQELN